MRTFLGFLLVGVVLYLALVAFIYLQQGAMLYPASRERVSAAAAGLPDFQDVEIETEDGERIVAWWKPPEPGRAVLIYFHGNGGGLVNRRFRAPLLVEGGRGLLLASYRGYSGSTGTPSEAGLRRDARAAYAFVASRYEPRRIVLYGESLGTGVAVGLAAEREVAGIVLDAPYSSTADVARHHFWYLPIWLMRDQFRSIDLVHRIQAPLLVLHGDRDGVIPIALGERLFAAAPEPKRSVRLPGVDHVSVLEHAIGEVRAFIAGVEARRP